MSRAGGAAADSAHLEVREVAVWVVDGGLVGGLAAVVLPGEGALTPVPAPVLLRRVRVEEIAPPARQQTRVVVRVPLRQGERPHHGHHQQAGEQYRAGHDYPVCWPVRSSV